MARLVFFNVPAHGHVNPTLPVVARLVEAGHSVQYFNSEAFAPQITQAGAVFRAYPSPNPSQRALAALVGNLVEVTLFLLEESQRLLPFCCEVLEEERPDLVVFDSIALWGMQAAALKGLPTAASITTLVQEGVKGMFTFRDAAHLLPRIVPLIPSLLRQRRALVKQYGPGVFPHKTLFPCVGDTNIVFTAQAFQPETRFVDERFHFVGPSVDAAQRLAVAFPWEKLAADRPRIYLSLGTLHNTETTFYHTAFSAFADHPGQFILSVGARVDPQSLGPIPPNFLVLPSVPQLALLPHVDVFVTHGGMNSLSEGLYFGVPLVVVPHHLEQVLNGRQAVRHGAARILGDGPPYGQISPATLRNAVDAVLQEAQYRQGAETVGASFRAAGGAERAAMLLAKAAQA